jgi:hypothetical protein
MEVAAKPEAAIDKGMAGPGLLAYVVTSKFSDYLPLYRLEDIFERQGFEISRATQSIWCGDVADLVKPLYELMAGRVRQSHVVATDDTILPMLSVGKNQVGAHVAGRIISAGPRPSVEGVTSRSTRYGPAMRSAMSSGVTNRTLSQFAPSSPIRSPRVRPMACEGTKTHLFRVGCEAQSSFSCSTKGSRHLPLA